MWSDVRERRDLPVGRISNPHSRVRSARRDNLRGCRRRNISIHAPRVGRDLTHFSQVVYDFLFQSTRPVWGATDLTGNFRRQVPDFNPRSPCGERHDGHSVWQSCAYCRFQSTLPVWGATCENRGRDALPAISIHAPRVGSDGLHKCSNIGIGISIHAPRVGSDALASRGATCGTIFQSTLPVWGATRSGVTMWTVLKGFQSTLPVWGATAEILNKSPAKRDKEQE